MPESGQREAESDRREFSERRDNIKPGKGKVGCQNSVTSLQVREAKCNHDRDEMKRRRRKRGRGQADQMSAPEDEHEPKLVETCSGGAWKRQEEKKKRKQIPADSVQCGDLMQKPRRRMCSITSLGCMRTSSVENSPPASLRHALCNPGSDS